MDSADYINKCIASIGKVLSSKFEHNPEHDVYVEPDVDYVFTMPAIEVSPYLVEVLLKEVSTSTTSSLANIRSDLLKHALLCVVLQFTELLQNSFDSGVFPKAWKNVNVTSIAKPRNK